MADLDDLKKGLEDLEKAKRLVLLILRSRQRVGYEALDLDIEELVKGEG